MKKYQFKTNINCSGCVANVTPHLNAAEGIKEWKVDTNHPSKILTITTEHLSTDELKRVVEKAGYKAELLVGNE